MRRQAFLSAAAIALASSMRGVAPIFPRNEPRLKVPAFVAARETPRNLRRRQKVAARKRHEDGQRNAENFAARLKRRFSKRSQRPDELLWRQGVINKMTNYERNQWAKAGYPIKKEEFEQYAHAAIYRATGEVVVR